MALLLAGHDRFVPVLIFIVAICGVMLLLPLSVLAVCAAQRAYVYFAAHVNFTISPLLGCDYRSLLITDAF